MDNFHIHIYFLKNNQINLTCYFSMLSHLLWVGWAGKAFTCQHSQVCTARKVHKWSYRKRIWEISPRIWGYTLHWSAATYWKAKDQTSSGFAVSGERYTRYGRTTWPFLSCMQLQIERAYSMHIRNSRAAREFCAQWHQEDIGLHSWVYAKVWWRPARWHFSLLS